VIYCDTGVENPILDRYVKALFLRLDEELQTPFRLRVLHAPVTDRFFVKVVGRGYPPPTNSFRWCTSGLRIRPVSRFIRDAALGDAVVALGLRRSESRQRDRSISRAGGEEWQTQIEGGRRYRMFLPILTFDVADVWDAIFTLPNLSGIDPAELAALYRGASGECPIVKAPESPPCATGRFGCWTCTVVRKDRSSASLIKAGYRELVPFMEFRDWLASIRNESFRRWPVRRNGSIGMGPFTLATRREILEKLQKLEAVVGLPIVSPEEQFEIQRLWNLDLMTGEPVCPGLLDT